MNNFKILVRSVNERTEGICLKSIQRDFPEIEIEIINKTPFFEALKETLISGINSGKKWIFCLDSDVLLKSGSIKKLLQTAESSKPDTFEIQGLINDKFIPICRPAGNHLYRVSLIPKALRLIELCKKEQRPESYLLKLMSKKGYPYIQTDILVGHHDYEQYYADIFRKCFLHTLKHKDYLEWIEPYWYNKLNEDNDFRIACFALELAKCSKLDSYSDKKFLNDKIPSYLKLLGLNEKSNIPKETEINDILSNLKLDIWQDMQNTIYPKKEWNKVSVIENSHRQKKNIKLLVLLGIKIQTVGIKLQQLSTK